MLNGPLTTLRLPGPFARRRGPSNSAPAFDPDAAAYIAAVEAADEQELEPGVKQAIDGFVTGCKSDGIWDAIKASCILAGARTLNGCLVPLTGPAPTNFNFVSADYDRVTGLKGDGSTKYLNSNRLDNDDPQNNFHLSVYLTSKGSANRCLIGTSLATGGSLIFHRSNGNLLPPNRIDVYTDFGLMPESGLLANSRSDAFTYTAYNNGVSENISGESQSPIGESVAVFRPGVTENQYSNGRLSFYSIGEAVDLAALDARVTTLMTEIEAALT